MKLTMKTIYELKLHEYIDRKGMRITRVAGGWIYMFWDDEKKDFYQTSTFVHFNNEFQEIDKMP